MSQRSKGVCSFSRLYPRIILSILLILTQSFLPVYAKTPDTITGTLFGYIYDGTMQPLPGVAVRVINVENGNQRATLTNFDGRYQINFLPIGRYRIEASREGLTVIRPTIQPVTVLLNQAVQALPPILMGPVPSTPPVIVATPPRSQGAVNGAVGQDDPAGSMANTVGPTRSANANDQQVSILALSGIRNFDDLTLLSPGVAPPPQVRGVTGPGIGSGIGSAGQFSVNGQRARSNNFTVDGSDNNDEDIGVRRQGFVAMVPQSVESIKEIQIVTHLWDAELGRSVGSQVNAVSKSGTNFFHGQLYDFFNHSALNARNFFDYSGKNAAPTRLTALAIDRFVNGQPVNPQVKPVRIDGQD